MKRSGIKAQEAERRQSQHSAPGGHAALANNASSVGRGALLCHQLGARARALALVDAAID